MLQKISVIELVKQFPDSFSLEDLIEEMILLDKIERGVTEADNKKVVSSNELDKIMKEWSK